MDSVRLQRTYLDLTTPHVADACLRLGIPVRCAPWPMHALWSGAHLAGRVLPVRHYGSVDLFLEALEGASRGDVLLVDNGGRTDEACVGDQVTLEVAGAGLSGIVIWGLHRDTRELATIRLPVFSLGTFPAGPRRLDEREPGALESARCGDHLVTSDDFALGDDDGVLFVPLARAAEVVGVAASIRDKERSQAARMHMGTSFRQQCRFSEYLASRSDHPALTFRQHLRSLEAAAEE